MKLVTSWTITIYLIFTTACTISYMLVEQPTTTPEEDRLPSITDKLTTDPPTANTPPPEYYLSPPANQEEPTTPPIRLTIPIEEAPERVTRPSQQLTPLPPLDQLPNTPLPNKPPYPPLDQLPPLTKPGDGSNYRSADKTPVEVEQGVEMKTPPCCLPVCKCCPKCSCNTLLHWKKPNHQTIPKNEQTTKDNEQTNPTTHTKGKEKMILPKEPSPNPRIEARKKAMKELKYTEEQIKAIQKWDHQPLIELESVPDKVLEMEVSIRSLIRFRSQCTYCGKVYGDCVCKFSKTPHTYNEDK